MVSHEMHQGRASSSFHDPPQAAAAAADVSPYVPDHSDEEDTQGSSAGGL